MRRFRVVATLGALGLAAVTTAAACQSDTTAATGGASYLVNGEEAFIGTDWSLRDNGVTYEQAWPDGQRSKPWIADTGRVGRHSVAVRVEATSSTDKDRNEFRYGYFPTEERRFTGFSVYIPPDFRMYEDMRLVMMQWWQGPGDPAPYPSIEIVVPRGEDPDDGTVLVGANIATGQARTNHGDVTTVGSTTVRKGRWVDIVMEWEVAPAGGGAARMWVDGQQVADYSGPLGLSDQSSMVDVRWGIYRNHSESTIPTSHTLYFDEVRVGDSRAEVVPAGS